MPQTDFMSVWFRCTASSRSTKLKISGSTLKKSFCPNEPFEAWILLNNTLTYDSFCHERIHIYRFEAEQSFFNVWSSPSYREPGKRRSHTDMFMLNGCGSNRILFSSFWDQTLAPEQLPHKSTSCFLRFYSSHTQVISVWHITSLLASK